MYRIIQFSGDAVSVPRLVFTRLADYDADDARFRVALYLLGGGGGDAAQVSRALGVEPVKVAGALAFWEGAGLLERVETQSVPSAIESAPKRRRMNVREVVQASATDQTLGMLTQELQRVFGGVVSEGDTCVFATLYLQDNFQADLILMVASHCAAQGKVNARYIEKVLISWRREGINDCGAADIYLKQLAVRELRENEMAAMMGMRQAAFSLAERRRIAEWFEDFGYGKEMIEAARLVAGDKKDVVKYLGAILKKWYAKGYKTPRDVQQAEQNHNLRVDGSRNVPQQQDMLQQQDGYTPMKQRRTMR